MAFDANVDYAKLIQAAAAKGDDAAVKSLSIQRLEKIAASQPLTEKYGNDTINQLAKTWQAQSTASAPAVTVASGAVPLAAPVAQAAPAAPAARDLTSEINALYAAQKQTRLTSLAKARDLAMSGLSAEQSKLAPQFYNARNSTQAQSDISARNFAQYMAARGSSGGGAAAQARISSDGALQGQLGALKGQELTANADISRRMSDVNTSSANDAYAAESDLLAQQALARIQEAQRVDGINLSQYNADRTYDRNALESDRSYELNKQTTVANLAASELDYQIKTIQKELLANPNSTDNQIKSLQLQSAKYELDNAIELAKYAPAEALARIAQIKASTSASYASIANGQADNTRQDAAAKLAADQAEQARLMNLWEQQGYAPPGITGVAAGTPIYQKPTSSPAAPVAKPMARDDLFSTISLAMNGKVDNYGNPVIPASGGAYAMAQLQKLYEAENIGSEDVLWAIANIPGLAAYAPQPQYGYSTSGQR